MKKKLIIMLAVCMAFCMVVNATANVEVMTEEELATDIEEIVEPEFFVMVEGLATEDEELGTSAEEIESDVEEEGTEVSSEIVEEIETETTTEPVIDEEPSEIETEINSEAESMPMDEVTETETMEVATENIEDSREEKTEYIEAVINDIVIGDEITENGERIFVEISGENLLGKCANIKVRPVNTYKDFYYIRTVVLDDDSGNIVRIALPENASGLYRVDVSVENAAREAKVVAIGESNDTELKCEANRKNALIVGQSKTEGVKSVMIKVLDEYGDIVFLRQVTTNSDGSYSVNATLPAESGNYIVWAVVEGEGGGYVKNVSFLGPDSKIANVTYTLTGAENEIKDVLIYCKNVLDKSKYIYEIDYSDNATIIEISDLCAFTGGKETDSGYTDNGKIEILSVSGGIIRFAVENDSEFDATKAWSGIINVVRLKKLTSQGVNIILKVYE